MGVWSHKESMAMKALTHTKEMEQRFAVDIKLSASTTKVYGNDTFILRDSASSQPKVQIQNKDSVSAAFDMAEAMGFEGRPCILNFASFKNPGGKFLDGSSAQEECLCHESYLYNVLEKFDTTYYAPHRVKGATNKSLYTNAALFTPDVTFIHNGIDFKASVLTCAAPNYTSANHYFGVGPKENAEVLYNRIEYVRYIMEDNNVKVAILGAFGCGVFGQDPNLVAKYMNDIFAKSNIHTIIYAIPIGLNERNFRAFKNRIAETEV